jgi:membrane fusion protein (multidrug efflux system)
LSAPAPIRDNRLFPGIPMKKTVVGGALLALLVAVAALSYWAGGRGSSAPATPVAAGSTKAPAGGPPPITVEAMQVAVMKLPQSITTVGSLRSEETVIVRPEIAGRITEILFKEGQHASRGQVLVKLDDSVQKADLERAKANLTLSASKYERAVDLRNKGFISSQAKDEAENNLKVAEADAALAAARLAKTAIVAPFGGTVGLRSVSVGDYVKEGQDMVNIEQIDTLKADFRVPETLMRQIRAGQTLQITLDAIGDKPYAGQVYAINPLIDANGRSIVIRANVPNVDGRLRPGMFARVRLFTSDIRDTLVVPEESLIPLGDDKYVYRVVDGKAQRQKVEIGQRLDGKVEIVSGLARGDRIVTAGVVKIRDGAPVQVANETPSGTSVGKAAVAPPKGNS